MNTIDRNILLGTAAVGTIVTLRYGWTEEKYNIPGLDVKNSKKLVAAITILAGSILIFDAISSMVKKQTV